nr:reverse transcriptase domain-containing protein [Tanacetum cinerariifolium]
MNFGLKNDMIQQVQNSCQFHGLPGDDANKHLDKFLHVTQSIKVNGVTDDALRLYLFPHSLTHHATDCLTLRHRDTINAAAGGTFMKRRPEECYDLIENITAHHNDWDTSSQWITPNCETCGGPHSYTDCPATVGQTQNVYAARAYQGIKKTIILRGTTKGETSSSRELVMVKTYQALVHQPLIPQPHVATTNEFTNFMKANDAILKNMQTNMTSLTNSNLELKNMFGQFMKMNTASSSGSRTFPVSAPKPNQKPSSRYPSRHHDQKLCPKANDQKEKFFQIFKDLNFNISLADALILMPNFTPTIKTLLTSKDKLSKLARTPLNEHRSAVLLKKWPEKLGDPDKFLILCDSPRMAECLALADLGASINLMPLSVWNKLSLPKLSLTCMTLELVDRLISRPVGGAEVVFVKVGTFHFPTNFVVVDFDADPRDNDFLLEEVDAFLALEDDPTLPKVDQSYVDTEGDILLLKAFLNDDPSLPLSLMETICLKFEKNLKFVKLKPINLQLMSLSGLNLRTYLPIPNTHSWKGINPEFCTHKILMEDDFEPVVQHQRRVNPKIHDVIKKEVLKLIDAGLIYPISDSP